MPKLASVFAALVWFATATAAVGQDIAGAGSTFAFPVIAEWAKAYQRSTGNHIEYQPTGSAAGLTSLRSKTVDFAVSDAPLVDPQLVRDGLLQFPCVIGAIVPVVNLAGIGSGQLQLTGQVIADIYLGKIRRWNDPALVALNPHLALPAQPILVVYRSDGSGTTYNWTDYLSKASTEWRAAVGSDLTVQWPVGFGGRGSGGIAEKVLRLNGAIGYIEYTYAVQSKLSYALVRNRAGYYATPSEQSFRSAIAAVDWLSEPHFHILVTDMHPADAYPIMATSFMLVREHPSDIDRARRTRAFLRWVLNEGQGTATALHYLPLPPQLVEQVEASWSALLPETNYTSSR